MMSSRAHVEESPREESLRRQNLDLQKRLNDTRAEHLKEIVRLREELAMMQKESGSGRRSDDICFAASTHPSPVVGADRAARLQAVQEELQAAKVQSEKDQSTMQELRTRLHDLKGFAVKRAMLFDRAMRVLKLFSKRQGFPSVAHYLHQIRDEMLQDASLHQVNEQIDREITQHITFDQAWLEACLDTMDESMEDEIANFFREQDTAETGVQTEQLVEEAAVQTETALQHRETQTEPKTVASRTSSAASVIFEEPMEPISVSPPPVSLAGGGRRRSSIFGSLMHLSWGKQLQEKTCANSFQDAPLSEPSNPPTSITRRSSLSESFQGAFRVVGGSRRASLSEMPERRASVTRADNTCEVGVQKDLPDMGNLVDRSCSPVLELLTQNGHADDDQDLPALEHQTSLQGGQDGNSACRQSSGSSEVDVQPDSPKSRMSLKDLLGRGSHIARSSMVMQLPRLGPAVPTQSSARSQPPGAHKSRPNDLAHRMSCPLPSAPLTVQGNGRTPSK
eukprot:TRINITY_DN35138_c0_g1_i1.p1 TRINITY_DN35138_c0_g1~~TRINITY_DN35138_c0_g1_i1.p1  ORF type:complete len:508 (-),score=98.63 TRINITY_DN35138_c0_g1_i1:160-1683(-)